MFSRDRLYAVYEKPEAADPIDRAVLVREGFSFWSFAFDAFWLLAKAQWLALAIYIALALALTLALQAAQMNESALFLSQFFLKLLLGWHASDIQGWTLKRKGYRFAGVLAADSELHAEQRYYQHAS